MCANRRSKGPGPATPPPALPLQSPFQQRALLAQLGLSAWGKGAQARVPGAQGLIRVSPPPPEHHPRLHTPAQAAAPGGQVTTRLRIGPELGPSSPWPCAEQAMAAWIPAFGSFVFLLPWPPEHFRLVPVKIQEGALLVSFHGECLSGAEAAR